MLPRKSARWWMNGRNDLCRTKLLRLARTLVPDSNFAPHPRRLRYLTTTGNLPFDRARHTMLIPRVRYVWLRSVTSWKLGSKLVVKILDCRDGTFNFRFY